MAKAKAKTKVIELNEKQREQIINALVTNCGCEDVGVFNENDRELLEGAEDARLVDLYERHELMAENQLVANAAREGFEQGDIQYVFNVGEGKFIPTLKHKGDTSTEEEEAGEENAEDLHGDDQGDDNHEEATMGGKKKVTSNQRTRTPAKPVTLNQFLTQAPPEVRALLTNALKVEQEQKDQLIEQITDNEHNEFNPEYLKQQDLPMLKALAKLANNSQPEQSLATNRFLHADYSGAAGPIGNAGGGAKFDDNDVLEIPTINWGGKDRLTKKVDG